VLSGILRSQLEHDWKDWEYLLSQLESAKNWNQQVGSLFYQNAELLGMLMGIGVDSLWC